MDSWEGEGREAEWGCKSPWLPDEKFRMCKMFWNYSAFWNYSDEQNFVWKFWRLRHFWEFFFYEKVYFVRNILERMMQTYCSAFVYVYWIKIIGNRETLIYSILYHSGCLTAASGFATSMDAPCSVVSLLKLCFSVSPASSVAPNAIIWLL